MQILRLAARCTACHSQRNLHTSPANFKALQNWKRPSIDEIFVPKEPWGRVHGRNQKRYNAQLAAGVLFFGGSVLVAANTVELNGTPHFVHKTGFVTTLPETGEPG